MDIYDRGILKGIKVSIHMMLDENEDVPKEVVDAIDESENKVFLENVFKLLLSTKDVEVIKKEIEQMNK